MRSAIPYLIQGNNIILVVDDQSYTVSKNTHISFTKIVEAIKAKDWDAVADLVDTKKAIVNFSKGNVSIEKDEVLWKGQPFHNALSTRMIEMFSQGFPVEPMVAFMERLMKNPSMRSVNQLYGFLEKNKLPITEDGFFLAYKKVRHDYMDHHSGTMRNAVGDILTMDRNQVDDDPNSYCSKGLHFCSLEYLSGFGDSRSHTMIVKVDPADVVSIPADANGSKGRACRYEVIAEVNGDPADAFSGIVDKKYSKTSQSGTCGCSTPGTDWPFKSDQTQLYNCVRVIGGAVEYTNMSLVNARGMVAKHKNQKKAKLKIVDRNGKEVK